jgi:hypothetical protein
MGAACGILASIWGKVAPLWWILAPIIAFAVTTAIVSVAISVMRLIRGRHYRRFEDKDERTLVHNFPLPAIDPSDAEQRRKSLSPLVGKAHKVASNAQTRYYNAVVGSAACLVLAFVALALGTLRATDLLACFDWKSAELLLNYIDVMAMSGVLALFVYGHWVSPPWIASRAGAELLRQYQILYVVFPDAISPKPAADLKIQFNTEADLVTAEVEDGQIVDITRRIQKFWNKRKELLGDRTLTEADLSTDALLVYLQRRARRQLIWFSAAKARLEANAEWRNVVLLILYCFTFMLAGFKLVLFLLGTELPLLVYVQPPLLFVTGLSASVTAYYINQNSRSLIHRYNTQERFITDWLTTFDKRWSFASLPLLSIDDAAKKDLRAEIFRFEDMMIEELLDWIHITGHDAIELAP